MKELLKRVGCTWRFRIVRAYFQPYKVKYFKRGADRIPDGRAVFAEQLTYNDSHIYPYYNNIVDSIFLSIILI